MHRRNTTPRQRMELLTLRMLGTYITLTRSQWEDLLQDIEISSELWGRIRDLIDS